VASFVTQMFLGLWSLSPVESEQFFHILLGCSTGWSQRPQKTARWAGEAKVPCREYESRNRRPQCLPEARESESSLPSDVFSWSTVICFIIIKSNTWNKLKPDCINYDLHPAPSVLFSKKLCSRAKTKAFFSYNKTKSCCDAIPYHWEDTKWPCLRAALCRPAQNTHCCLHLILPNQHSWAKTHSVHAGLVLRAGGRDKVQWCWPYHVYVLVVSTNLPVKLNTQNWKPSFYETATCHTHWTMRAWCHHRPNFQRLLFNDHISDLTVVMPSTESFRQDPNGVILLLTTCLQIHLSHFLIQYFL
jgi:hypothetical protein